MARIYTKVGDKGGTSLLGGQKVQKNNERIEAYGTVDELNSFIGFTRAELEKQLKGSSHSQESFSKLNSDLETLQHWLFDLGGLLASEEKDREKFKLTLFTLERIKWLETRIDEMTAVMPVLKEFILPGGSELASRVHLARTVCRRAERKMVELGDDSIENGIPFVNRLSDYLFTLARFSNHLLGIQDITWKNT